MHTLKTSPATAAACLLMALGCVSCASLNAEKAGTLKKDAEMTRSMAPCLCMRRSDLAEMVNQWICLRGPVGVGKRGLFIAVEDVPVYIDDHRDESIVNEHPLLAQSKSRKLPWRMAGVLHHTQRHDFRTGLGGPMKDHYWLEVTSAEVLRD